MKISEIPEYYFHDNVNAKYTVTRNSNALDATR